MSNKNIKALAMALSLSRRDIAEIVTLGGIPTSTSRADSWLRGSSSAKTPTGNSDFDGTISRSREITTTEFDAFCAGLRSWLDKDASKD